MLSLTCSMALLIFQIWSELLARWLRKNRYCPILSMPGPDAGLIFPALISATRWDGLMSISFAACGAVSRLAGA